MVERLSQFLVGPADGGVLHVPLTVAVPGQPLPVRVALRMQLTFSELVLSPATLYLGRITLGEAAGAVLTLTNPGKLPQTFSFGRPGAGRNSGVTITPGDGFGTVLPGESVALTVAFRPPIAGPQHFRLRCVTLVGRSFEVEGRCEGVDAPLALSHNAVKVSGGARGASHARACALAMHVCPQAGGGRMPRQQLKHRARPPPCTRPAACYGGRRLQHGVARDHQPRRQPPGV